MHSMQHASALSSPWLLLWCRGWRQHPFTSSTMLDQQPYQQLHSTSVLPQHTMWFPANPHAVLTL
jgi:hypothetical protein